MLIVNQQHVPMAFKIPVSSVYSCSSGLDLCRASTILVLQAFLSIHHLRWHSGSLLFIINYDARV